MPLPRSVARFNRVVTNRSTGRLAKCLPTFGVIVHIGRRTHREYRTPVNVFRSDGDHSVIALTYGPDVEWLKTSKRVVAASSRHSGEDGRSPSPACSATTAARPCRGR